MTDNELELLRAIEQNTRVIAHLLSLSVARDVGERIKTVLDTEQKRIAYSICDGETSAREVARVVGISHPTVGKWWLEWKDLGLVEMHGKRAKAILDLELFGLIGVLSNDSL